MAFLRRMGWFLVGVGLGTLLVIFMFGDREFQCSYFPNDRVLADLQKKELLFSTAVDCQNTCLSADSTFYSGVLNNSNVDFDFNKRGTDNTCNTYKLDYEGDNGLHSFYIKNCDSTATVMRWTLPEGVSCDCPEN